MKIHAQSTFCNTHFDQRIYNIKMSGYHCVNGPVQAVGVTKNNPDWSMAGKPFRKAIALFPSKLLLSTWSSPHHSIQSSSRKQVEIKMDTCFPVQERPSDFFSFPSCDVEEDRAKLGSQPIFIQK